MADLSFLTDGSHEQVVYVTHRAARAAQPAALPDALSPDIAAALAAQGITSLFTHQRRVWDLLAEGRNVVVATGTASGKSLAFALPTLDAFARDPTAGRSSCTPPKRSPRTRRASSPRCACRGRWPRSTTATRRGRSAPAYATAPPSC